MDHEKIIKNLKKLTAEKTANFVKVFEYFIDNVVENRDLIQNSKFYCDDDDLFKAMLKPPLQSLNNSVTVERLILMRVKKFDFIHGTIILSDGTINGMYFYKDILMGIAAITPRLERETHFFRLSGFIQTIKENPSKDSFAAKIVNTTLQ